VGIVNFSLPSFNDCLPLVVCLHEQSIPCVPGHLFNSCHPIDLQVVVLTLGGGFTFPCSSTPPFHK
jgi:hypothetical protein